MLDKKGKQIAEFSLKGLERLEEREVVGYFSEDLSLVQFSEGLLPVQIETEDGESQYGFINEKGEWKIKPSSKMKEVSSVHNGHFIFSDGEGYGLKDIKGETDIRAKYEHLYFATNDVLVYAKEKGKWGMLDLKGEEIFNGEDYEGIIGAFKGGYYLAGDSQGTEFIDSKGKPVSTKVDIENIGFDRADRYVVSDFLAYDELFAKIGITANSISKLKLEMTAKEIADIIKQEDPAHDFNQDANYQRSNLDYGISYGNVGITISTRFELSVVSHNWETEENEFSDEKPVFIIAFITCEGKLDGKQDETFAAAKNFAETLGKYAGGGNEERAIYKLPDGNYLLVQTDGTRYVSFVLAKKEMGEMLLKSIE